MQKEISGSLSVEDHKTPTTDSDNNTDDDCLLTVDRRPAAEQALVRKLDTRLLPTIVAIYIMNYIDRTAIASARLQGLEQDLHMSENQYNVVLAVLFIAYCPVQIPSNMILNSISRPSLYIGACTIVWGLTSLLAGVTRNFASLLACRIFIGFPEATFYPGAIYLFSRWYTRKELALRCAILYCGLMFANAFGSLIAAGILSEMEGKLGIRAWRWLFFIEGAVTIFIGLQALWLLPNYPHNTRWLSAAERRLARVRIAEDAGEADEDGVGDTPYEGLKSALKDPKVYVFAITCFCADLAMGFINFFPTLTATLGFSTTITLLIAAPPWMLTVILCVFNSRHVDKTGERFWHITLWWWSVILGLIIAQSTMSVGGRYASLFFLASGEIGLSILLVWVSSSIPRPPSKRAAAIGLVNGFGNIGNLTSSFIWKVEWSPQYRPSMMIAISSMFTAICLAYAVRTILIRENQLLDRDEMGTLQRAKQERVEQAARLEGISVEEAMKKRRGFRNLY